MFALSQISCGATALTAANYLRFLDSPPAKFLVRPLGSNVGIRFMIPKERFSMFSSVTITLMMRRMLMGLDDSHACSKSNVDYENFGTEEEKA